MVSNEPRSNTGCFPRSVTHFVPRLHEAQEPQKHLLDNRSDSTATMFTLGVSSPVARCQPPAVVASPRRPHPATRTALPARLRAHNGGGRLRKAQPPSNQAAVPRAAAGTSRVVAWLYRQRRGSTSSTSRGGSAAMSSSNDDAAEPRSTSSRASGRSGMGGPPQQPASDDEGGDGGTNHLRAAIEREAQVDAQLLGLSSWDDERNDYAADDGLPLVQPHSDDDDNLLLRLEKHTQRQKSRLTDDMRDYELKVEPFQQARRRLFVVVSSVVRRAGARRAAARGSSFSATAAAVGGALPPSCRTGKGLHESYPDGMPP